MRDLGALLNETAAAPVASHLGALAAPAPVGASQEEALRAMARALSQGSADAADRACLEGAKALKAGDHAAAVRKLSQAIQARADHALAFHLLGGALRALGKIQAALAAHRQAATLQPNNADHQAALGEVLQFCGQTAEAIDAFQAAYLHSRKDVYLIKAMTLIPAVQESEAQIEQQRALLAEALAAAGRMDLRLELPLATGLHLFNLAYHGCDDRPILEALSRLILAACPDAAYVAPHLRRGEQRPFVRGRRKLRLALLSRFFKRHTIGNLFIGLVEKLPRDDIEILLFSVDGGDDEMAARFRRAADYFVPLPQDIALARREIGKRKPDILLYSDIGMEGFTHSLAFSRLAPVQCATWGHPVTSGIPTVDCYLSAEDLEPDGSEAAYSERLVRLSRPGCCYERPKDEVPPRRRADFGLPDRGPLYVCPQSAIKLHPAFDGILDSILQRDAQGHVVLLAPWSDAMTRALSARLASRLAARAERVRFLPALPKADFLALLSLCDVMLDPLHFGGGNTNYEACHVGLPVVTLPGRFMRARFAYALYRQMGIDATLAADPEDYVELAVTIANDPPRQAALKRLIRSRSDAVFEDRAVLAELAERFIEMAEAAQATPGSGYKKAHRS